MLEVQWWTQRALWHLMFSGVFERHPQLKGISMEHGAFWLPSWLQALDYTARTARRLVGDIERPSDTVRRHLKFSPFAGEPVGWLIEQCGDDLFLFSSDYPHPEGTKDPIQRFESTMTSLDDDALDAFYARNFATLYRDDVPA